uniref:Glycosyltransferase 2-like domain-containing protein n=1 Tax=viral metagenome TaxID=1070528 RepID=A0A6C0JED9_9ZZZZ
MKTFTICIPCVDKHIEKVHKLLESLEKHIIKPNKVIISLSPKYLNLDLHEEKKKLEAKFPFLLCLVQNKVTNCGENVNYIFDKVETDYTIIWGADDFFHPQYLEIMNYIIQKYNPNIISHLWDTRLTKLTKQNPNLAYDFDVFSKINLNEIVSYNDKDIEIYMHPNDGRGRQVPRFHIKQKFISNLHYGMQILKTNIIKDNKFLTGPDYDYRSDTLFLTDMYKKYGNMCIIMENLIQYVEGNTCV